MADEHAGHRKRMRARFLNDGLDGFADHEVLELALFFAIPQRNVNPLAHRLIRHFGSLHAVLEADAASLMRVEGVGEYAATLLTLFSHVARRMEKSRRLERGKIANRAQAQRYCQALLSGLRQECFYAVCLNAEMEVLGDALIARGSLGEVPAYPRLVAEAALRYNAHSLILCHNHPGGSLVPSLRDIEATRVLQRLLDGLEVALADHIIVAGGETLSMAGCGLLRRETAASKETVLYPAVDDGLRAADSSGEGVIRARLRKLQKEKENHENRDTEGKGV